MCVARARVCVGMLRAGSCVRVHRVLRRARARCDRPSPHPNRTRARAQFRMSRYVLQHRQALFTPVAKREAAAAMGGYEHV